MAWIYEKSAAWRAMVRLSKQSPLYTAIFGVAFVGIPYGVGKLVMWGTNPETISPEWEKQLKAQQTVDYKVAQCSPGTSGAALSHLTQCTLWPKDACPISYMQKKLRCMVYGRSCLHA